LNENLSDEIARRLRAAGVDAVSSHETGMDTQDDYAQMQFAVLQNRALVTINKKDFIRIHAQYKANGWQHWGIILTKDVDVVVIHRRLLKLVGALQADELKNKVLRLHNFR
jgi:hypothetical protein